MIAAGAVIAGLALIWLACAGWLAARQRIAFRQALLHVPVWLLWRVDAAALGQAHEARSTIFVVSHQSRLDPALMLALLPADTLHILDEGAARSIWLEPWRELARTITFNPRHIFISRRLVRILRGGGRLCVYMPPEVEPDTRTFRLYRGVARIARQAGASVVAIHVAGSRDLPLSLTPASQAPRRLFARLTVHALEARTIDELMARAGPAASRPSNALFDRCAEARFEASDPRRTLFRALADAASLHGGGRIAVEDAMGTTLTYRRLMTGVRVLAGRFARLGAPGDAIGLLLPNAAATAVAFFAVQSAGRVAAMLNQTAGPAGMALAARTGELRIVVSSRAFVEQAGLDAEVSALEAAGARMLWLEDVRARTGAGASLLAALASHRPVVAARPQAPAAMLFTSGSEGTPRAVLLSHENLVANAAQVAARIAFSRVDTLFNVLPAFHALGLTGGMILPLLNGVRLHLYPSPLHDRHVPETVAKVKPTVMLGTDTFLAANASTAADGDFASLRLVVAGAEPVRPETRRVWRERFGAAIVEGFGMTECSPVVSVNTATHGRDGTLGRLLPRIQARLEPVEGIGDGGRLFIRGPNVMLGYRLVDRPGETIAPPDGWHDSGDIAVFDKEGYLVIRGRAEAGHAGVGRLAEDAADGRGA